MGSLSDLADRLDALADSLPKKYSDLAANTAIELVTALVYKTPVDTTTALSNWQTTLGTPAGDMINPYVPGFLGYTLNASAEMTISQCRAAVATKKPGEPIFITNNADYIIDLEHGSSKQAPSGFMQISMMIARTYLENQLGR